MIGSKVSRLFVVAVAAISLGGCRIKSVESFESSVTPGPPSPGKGDPYTFGGMAEGTGGLRAKTSYATDSTSPDPLSETESGRAGRVIRKTEEPSTLDGDQFIGQKPRPGDAAPAKKPSKNP